MTDDTSPLHYQEIRRRPVGRLGPLIGAVDAGSSSVRFLVFVASGELVTYHQVPLTPPDRQRPECLVSKVVECIDATVSNLRQLDVDAADVLAVGLSTVRSTTFAWDRVTGVSLCSEVRDDNE